MKAKRIQHDNTMNGLHESSKIQASNSKEIPKSKLQKRTTKVERGKQLRIGNWSLFEAWNLKLGISAKTSRRHFLTQSGSGIGLAALGWLLQQNGHAAQSSPYTAKPMHFAPTAKRIIHVCALGGVSHVDTFDPKPELTKRHGQEYKDKNYDPFFGKPGRIRQSPWEFHRHGQSGIPMSTLLPHLATCVDELAFVYSMHSKSSNHTPATFLENTGFTLNGFPSLGAWISYGLGSENQDLPAFIVLPDARGLPAGGSINWTPGFLPSVHQGVAFNTEGPPISDLETPANLSPAARKASMEFLARMNQKFAGAHPHEDALRARIRSYELAAKMQLSVPEITDIQRESKATRELYGADDELTGGFGRNCLLARRLSERGVRFVQVFNGGAFGSPRINWDAHEDLVRNHGNQAATMDRPVAGLIKDLKSRGLLDETLVLWTTEFGRTPVTQGLDGKGRDHHPGAFTVWMAGGGIKGGTTFGSTDGLGFYVREKPQQFYDIHATMLHLMGMDHEALTYYHNGIQRRLTDVHGHVIHELLA